MDELSKFKLGITNDSTIEPVDWQKFESIVNCLKLESLDDFLVEVQKKWPYTDKPNVFGGRAEKSLRTVKEIWSFKYWPILQKFVQEEKIDPQTLSSDLIDSMKDFLGRIEAINHNRSGDRFWFGLGHFSSLDWYRFFRLVILFSVNLMQSWHRAFKEGIAHDSQIYVAKLRHDATQIQKNWFDTVDFLERSGQNILEEMQKTSSAMEILDGQILAVQEKLKFLLKTKEELEKVLAKKSVDS